MASRGRSGSHAAKEDETGGGTYKVQLFTRSSPLLARVLSCFLNKKASNCAGTAPGLAGRREGTTGAGPGAALQRLGPRQSRQDRMDGPLLVSWLSKRVDATDARGRLAGQQVLQAAGGPDPPQALLSSTFPARGLMAPVRFIWEGASGSFTAPRLGFSSTRGFAC